MSVQDFELLETRELDELNSTGRIYRHATGARVVSIANPQDENKVFGITFRTPPTDSTGLPHILEHSVLCLAQVSREGTLRGAAEGITENLPECLHVSG